MHKRFYGQNSFWEKNAAFLKSHKCRGEKQGKPRIIVSMFLRTFELTALPGKKFPPPPPLLHPDTYASVLMTFRSHQRSVCACVCVFVCISLGPAMCMSMCACAFISTYYTCIYMNIYTCRVYLCTYIHADVSMCIHMYICIFTEKCPPFTFSLVLILSSSPQPCMLVNTYTHVHIYIYMCMHKNISKYIYMYT